MTRPAFRVGYLDKPPHPAFLERMAEAPQCEVIRIDPADGEAEVLRQLATCDAYYVRAARDELPLAYHVTETFLARMPRLLLAATYGAGYDTIDVAACTRAGVAVCNQGGGNAEAVAEHALAMILSLLKRIPEAEAAIGTGTAENRSAFMGRELYGRTVGLVGLGHVGTRTARYLAAFDCEVLAHDPYLDAETVTARGAQKVDLATLMDRSDIVSLHCPLTDETRGMISAEALGRLPEGAILVSTARGGIHDEDAVLAALRSGRLAGAGLDVWKTEPPAPDHPLYTHPLVISTSHTAGVTGESRTRVATMAAEVFAEAAAGRVPPRMLNPEVRDTFVTRLAALA